MNTDVEKNVAWLSFEKTRSVRACLADAWRAYALQPGKYVVFLAIPLLLAGLAFTAAGYVVGLFYTDCLLPLRLFARTGADAAALWKAWDPPVRAWMLVGAAILLTATGFFAWSGAAAAQIRYVRRAGRLPRATDTAVWRDALCCGGRALAVAALETVVMAVVGGGVGWLCAKSSGLWLALFAVIAVYVCVTGAIVTVSYAVEHRSFRSSLSLATKGFLRMFGGFLIIGLLTFVPIGIVTFVAHLPLLTLQLSAHAAAMSCLMGDAVSAPALTPALYFSCGTMIGAFSLFNITMQLWAFSYRLAADDCRTKCTN